jgi:hypothetical protein
MAEPSENACTPRERLTKEYQDPHYHDEDEPLQAEDVPPTGLRLPSHNKAKRNLTVRRDYDADF